TAFYMFRLYFGIFWGTENKELHAHHTPHEAPWTMTFPLIFLAVVTCVAGFIPFGHYVSADGQLYDIHLDWNVAGTSIVIAVASIALATYIYMGEKQPVAEAMQEKFQKLHRWAFKRFYMDEVYQYITHRIIFARISTPIAWFDRHVVDGFFDFLAWGTNALGYQIRGLQSGSVQKYAFVFLLGIIILLLIMIL
ncbi:MAG: NADH-quinone oxidoreductase subunit L, partial [Bacteroidales bacterium]